MHDATGFRPVFDSEEEEDAYRKNARDNARIKNPLQARDSKKREKSEIDSAFGKRGSKEREEKSQELHDTKRKEGSSNWNNRDYQGLVDGNYEKSHISNMQRAGLVLVGGSIIIGTIAEDFFTGGLGIADDPATLSAGGGIIITAFTH